MFVYKNEILIFKKLTHRLLDIFALFTFSFTQPILAAGKTVETSSAAMKVKVADKIDINTATSVKLTTIKGIGEGMLKK